MSKNKAQQIVDLISNIAESEAIIHFLQLSHRNNETEPHRKLLYADQKQLVTLLTEEK